MVNKKLLLGMLVLTLVFGMTVVGCASTGPQINYYDLGDVSEENCALIVVSPIYQIYDAEKGAGQESDYSYSNFVKIDGQGGKGWQPPPGSFFGNLTNEPKAIVRVTPGTHTFTITFFFSDEYEVPVSITYDCKAGKTYSFIFLVKRPEDLGEMFLFTMTDDGNFRRLEAVDRSFKANATIIISEDGKKTTLLTSTSNVVAKKTESFNFNPDQNPNDRGKLVKR